jgi:hypothetical protein
MEAVDLLLKELDDHWENGLAPDIVKMLSRAGSASVELCAADLEWRWRRSRHTGTASGLAAILPERPAAVDYQALIPELWRIRECRLELIESEWIARSVWGDEPHVESFLKLWAADGVTAEALMRKLGAVSPLFLSVFRDGFCKLTIPAPAEFIIGRRKSDEPPAPAWIPDTRRLLMAEGTDLKISRNQASVRRTRIREVYIENLSAKAELPLGSRTLRPRSHCHLPIPLQVAFNGVQIVLEEGRVEE